MTSGWSCKWMDLMEIIYVHNFVYLYMYMSSLGIMDDLRLSMWTGLFRYVQYSFTIAVQKGCSNATASWGIVCLHLFQITLVPQIFHGTGVHFPVTCFFLGCFFLTYQCRCRYHILDRKIPEVMIPGSEGWFESSAQVASGLTHGNHLRVDLRQDLIGCHWLQSIPIFQYWVMRFHPNQRT